MDIHIHTYKYRCIGTFIETLAFFLAVTPILVQEPVLFRGNSTISFMDLFFPSSIHWKLSVLMEITAKMGESENNKKINKNVREK